MTTSKGEVVDEEARPRTGYEETAEAVQALRAVGVGPPSPGGGSGGLSAEGVRETPENERLGDVRRAVGGIGARPVLQLVRRQSLCGAVRARWRFA